MEARATSYDHQILRSSKSVDDKAVCAARGPKRRSGSEESEAARESLPETTEVRGTTFGDRISGFSLRDTEEHACVVGFFRRRLDLHRSVW